MTDVNIDRKEAYARLVAMRYYRQISDVKDGELKVFTVLPKKYLPDVKIAPLFVQRHLKMRGKDMYDVDAPTEVMKQLLDIEPFSNTHEMYINKYAVPEHLFMLNNLAEKRVYYQTYYMPTEKKEDGRYVKVDKEEYKQVNVERIKTKKSVLEKYILERNGQRYVAVFELFEERPPRRGLLWKQDAVAKFSEDYLLDAVRLLNLSTKAFKPVRNLIKTTEKGDRKYLIYHEVWKNPVLGIDRDRYVVMEVQGEHAKYGYISRDKVENMDKFFETLREEGLEGLEKMERGEEKEESEVENVEVEQEEAENEM